MPVRGVSPETERSREVRPHAAEEEGSLIVHELYAVSTYALDGRPYGALAHAKGRSEGLPPC